MQLQRRAFTLVEVLISITLLSLVLMALYKSSDLLRRSNKHLYHHLEEISEGFKGSQVLYLDLLQSDGNVTIENREKGFDHLLIANTEHSLYGFSRVRVSWLVYKEQGTLLRVEGFNYQLPLKEEDRVEIDNIAQGIELFKFYKNKKRNKLLITMKSKGKIESFMIQNIQFKLSNKELGGGIITGGARGSIKRTPQQTTSTK